jgi:hypothetical protein
VPLLNEMVKKAKCKKRFGFQQTSSTARCELVDACEWDARCAFQTSFNCFAGSNCGANSSGIPVNACRRRWGRRVLRFGFMHATSAAAPCPIDIPP